MKDKFLLDRSVVLLLFTIAAITGIYYYELGSCFALNIPTEYISIDITRYSTLFVLFLGVVTFFLIVILIFDLSRTGIKENKIKNLIISISLIISIIYFIYRNDFYIAFPHLFSSVFETQHVMIIAGILLYPTHFIILHSNKLFEETKLNKYYFIINHIIDIPLIYVAHYLVGISLITMIMFSIGYRNSTIYCNCKEITNKPVLLKMYGSNMIYGHRTNDSTYNIYIESNFSKSDTLRFIK